jgi:hypothetical protein
VQAAKPWAAGHQLLASVPSGDTIMRIRFGWGFEGYVSLTANLLAVSQNIQILGLVTTVGNGTEAVPNARTASSDAAPPTQRWLWWEGRSPRPNIVASPTADVVWCSDSPRSEADDAKGQVLATGIPAGQTLNLWASWAPAGAWDSTGDANLYMWASILLKTP